MKVLGIETSGNVGGIAICGDKHIIVTRGFGTGMHHGRELVPTVKTVLNEIGWKPGDIDLIAVDVGPGSYTGLRIGVTCAKTFAYALHRPVIDIPVFDIIAENYRAENHDHITLPPSHTSEIGNLFQGDILTREGYYLCPVLDAKRNHVYACIYKFIPIHLEQGFIQYQRLSEFLVIRPHDLLSILPRPVIIFGDGVPPYKDIFQQKDIFIDKEEKATPKAEYVALLGERAYESGRRCEIEKLMPLYLRRAEAIEKQNGQQTTDHRQR